MVKVSNGEPTFEWRRATTDECSFMAVRCRRADVETTSFVQGVGQEGVRAARSCARTGERDPGSWRTNPRKQFQERRVQDRRWFRHLDEQ